MRDYIRGFAIFALGLFFAILVFFHFMSDQINAHAEKSGVWINGDMAYKLVRIEK